MNNIQETYGNLFGSIELINENHLDLILSTMDTEHSLIYLIESVKSAYNKGAYTIGETEVISKAIRVLTRLNKEE
jgi:hypothetical protein